MNKIKEECEIKNSETESRLCTKCNLEYPFTEEYFYKNTTGKLTTPCKRCRIDAQKERYKKNKEVYNDRSRRHYKENRERYIELVTQWNRDNREKARQIQREWQKNNKDKLREYQQQRWSNKKHSIPEKEWKRCKEYFDYKCAYCGMYEEDHKKKYKQQLHKEHVIHDGRNDIKNCVPSCKICNGSKHTATLNQWYNISHPNYSRERYVKIYQWLRYDCKPNNI